MKILSGRQQRPRRILLYGQHGIGKSTWAAGAPSPIFLNIEDGIADIECAKTEVLKSYGDVVSAVSWLIGNTHEFSTVVVDTLDWLEHLIHQEVARHANKANITEIGYGKGYEAARDKWDFLLRGLDRLRLDRGIMVILLAHAKVQRFDNPETDAYDRYELDLHKSSNGMIQEWCDEVLFASHRVFVRSEDLGFGKERKIAVGAQERYIRTTETPAAIAKNRLRLPAELKMEWADYARHMTNQPTQPASQPAARLTPSPAPLPLGNIDGVVVNGSSKTTV